jgi:HTH-type transcriptional regulator / antitoxin HipB
MLMTTSTDIANVIRDRRRDLDYSQARVAEMIGMSRQWVVRFENGHEAATTVDLLLSLVHALELDLDLKPR